MPAESSLACCGVGDKEEARQPHMSLRLASLA